MPPYIIFYLLIFFYLNRDALSLLKMSPTPKATPAMAAPDAPRPLPTLAAAPPPTGSRPNIPPLSVPGKPGAPVSTPLTLSLSVCGSTKTIQDVISQRHLTTHLHTLAYVKALMG